MPFQFQNPDLQNDFARALEEARLFRESAGEGFLSSAGVGLNKFFSGIGNAPNQLFFGEDFPAIREKSSELPGFIQTETARKPQTDLEKLGQGLGAAALEIPLDAALIAGTGGLGASAVLPRAGQLFAGGALAGAIGGATVPETLGLDPESRGTGAVIGGATAGVLGAGLPIALRPLSKYIPGVKNLVPDVSLREAFDESIQTAAMGESTDLATALLPRDDVVDAFLANGGPGLRLRALGEAIDSKSRAIKGDLPFRRLTADPQFTADTIVQKGLRTAGLTSPQTKFLMESLTAHERAALSVTIDPLSETFEAGNLPLSEAMARAVERVAGPEKQALVKRLVAEGSAHSDKFKDLLKTSLKGFDLEAPTEEAIQAAATRLDDVIEEEPMLGILLPKLFDDTVTPGQAVRMATHVNPPPSIVKSPLRKAISKGTTSLFNFLRNTRMAGMLTSLTAPMKNITFTGININANVAGRAVAGIGSKRVYRGEAMWLRMVQQGAFYENPSKEPDWDFCPSALISSRPKIDSSLTAPLPPRCTRKPTRKL
jgi:hypothetical protein